ncbi:MAG: type IV pilus biogenesis/stability protein PilW [Gammaproteobacteria bacterium]|nr:type IV pilus biogenesis/stability protein PilW [Gammaproteobacteria bacterium]
MDRLLKAVRQDDSNELAYSSLGLLNVRLGQYEEAEENFKKAISLAPDNSSIRNNYGVFLCKLKRYKESKEQFLNALKNPLYQTPENAYLNIGVCSADKVQAEKYFRQALRENPEFSIALLSMARLSLELKRYLSARAYLQRFHAVQKPTPSSLWISVQVEKVLGDKNLMESRALLLKRKYPDSEETRQYLLWKKNE